MRQSLKDNTSFFVTGINPDYHISTVHAQSKYSWSQDGLNDLVPVISDNESELVLNSLLQCITNLCDTNVIAEKNRCIHFPSMPKGIQI